MANGKLLKCIGFCLLLVGITLLSVRADDAQTADQFLSTYKESKRVILVFPDSSDSLNSITSGPSLDQELRGCQAKLEPRDCVVLFLPSHSNVFELYSNTTLQFESDKIRAKFGIKDGQFGIVLLGKDGMEKYRTVKTFVCLEVLQAIDALADRKAEVEALAEANK